MYTATEKRPDFKSVPKCVCLRALPRTPLGGLQRPQTENIGLHTNPSPPPTFVSGSTPLAPSGNHYCIDIVVPSSDHCCIETVAPPSDHLEPWSPSPLSLRHCSMSSYQRSYSYPNMFNSRDSDRVVRDKIRYIYSL